MTVRIPGLILILAIPVTALCQTHDLYQYNYATISPAFTGLDGMKITAMGTRVDRSWRRDYSSFAGFEGKIRNVGFGVNATTDNYDLPVWQINVPFNYQLRLGDSRRLVFGGKVGVQHTEFDRSFPVSGHYILSALPAGSDTERISQTGWTGGLGVAYKGRVFFAGFSVDNVVRSRHEANYLPNQAVYHLMMGKDFGGKSKVEYSYSIYSTWWANTIRIDLNNSILILKRGIVGFTVILDGDVSPALNLGYRFKDVAQFVAGISPGPIDDWAGEPCAQMFLQFKIK